MTSHRVRPNRGRRNLCQLAAASVLLPRLESFAAAATPPRDPQRFVTLFFPNGVYPDAWQSQQAGDQLRLGGTLAPLGPFADRGVILEGLDHPLPGHLGQTSGFLSGHDFEPGEGGVITAKKSLDQMIAERHASQTYLPSLNLAMEPPSQGAFGDRPRSFGNSISWSSPTHKIEPQVNPQQAFDEVFFGQSTAGRQAARRRQSIVDQVWSQVKVLQPRVSHLDRARLDQYTASVGALQTKLSKSIDEDARRRADRLFENNRPGSAATPGDYAEHMRLMMDIMLLSLQTDSTRVATMVMGHSISRVVYDFVDSKIKTNHHGLSHHRNDPAKIEHYNLVTRWFAQQAAYFLERMAEIEDVSGSLLDNSLVLFGSGMKDGNVHERKNVPIALFGGGGVGLRGGRRLECPDGSLLANLHMSLAGIYGIEADDFNGVVTSGVEGLI